MCVFVAISCGNENLNAVFVFCGCSLADFNRFLFGFLFFSSVLVGALFLVFAFGAGSLYAERIRELVLLYPGCSCQLEVQ